MNLFQVVGIGVAILFMGVTVASVHRRAPMRAERRSAKVPE